MDNIEVPRQGCRSWEWEIWEWKFLMIKILKEMILGMTSPFDIEGLNYTFEHKK